MWITEMQKDMRKWIQEKEKGEKRFKDSKQNWEEHAEGEGERD